MNVYLKIVKKEKTEINGIKQTLHKQTDVSSDWSAISALNVKQQL